MGDISGLVFQQVVGGLFKENATFISRSFQGLPYILEFLSCWILQKRLWMFDWEYLAIKERKAFEYTKEKEEWLWMLLPNKRIEKVWNEIDDIVYI